MAPSGLASAVLLLLGSSIDAFQLYGRSPLLLRSSRCCTKLGLFDAFKSPEEFAVLQARKELAAIEDIDEPDTSARRKKLREAREKLKVAEAGVVTNDSEGSSTGHFEG